MNRRGFTLIEVLVAIVIVGLVSASTLAAFAAAARASERARTAVVAAELVEERLASLLVLPAGVLADSADGVERDIAGMVGWRWSASSTPIDHGWSRLTIRVVSDGGATEHIVLRPKGDP